MRRIQSLSHTADLRIQVAADSLTELFQAGLEGMNDLLLPGGCRPGGKRSGLQAALDLRAADETFLLIDCLSRLLTLSHLRQALFCRLDIRRLEGGNLEADAQGRPVAGFARDIKAVAYHQADVRRRESGLWETVIVFDI